MGISKPGQIKVYKRYLLNRVDVIIFLIIGYTAYTEVKAYV